MTEIISEKTGKLLSKIILWGFLAAFVGTAIFINRSNKDSRKKEIDDFEIHAVIMEIHQEKSDIPRYRGRMSNGDWITINRPMVYSAAVGDSLLKEKGADFYTLKKKRGTSTIWKF